MSLLLQVFFPVAYYPSKIMQLVVQKQWYFKVYVYHISHGVHLQNLALLREQSDTERGQSKSGVTATCGLRSPVAMKVFEDLALAG